MSTFMNSDDDRRVVNNVVRHEYRVLTALEKEQMKAIKDMGLEFICYINDNLTPTRELSLAKTKMEEAVMWAVKSITA
jgi:predicted ABC-class ATPase